MSKGIKTKNPPFGGYFIFLEVPAGFLLHSRPAFSWTARSSSRILTSFVSRMTGTGSKQIVSQLKNKKDHKGLFSFLLEVPAGFEPAIAVLQTAALPLGDGTIFRPRDPNRLKTCFQEEKLSIFYQFDTVKDTHSIFIMQSLRSKIIYFFFKLLNAKKIVSRHFQEHLRLKPESYPPKNFYKNYNVKEKEILGERLFTFTPHKTKNKKHIFYIHGGAYVLQASKHHWKFINKLIKCSKTKLSFVDYPLAPEHNYKETFKMIKESYKQLFRNSDEEIVIIGYSAGGGLALALAEEAEKLKTLPTAHTTVLLSPWLDINLTNTSDLVLKHDIILDKQALIDAGKLYSQTTKNNSILSPLYGDLSKVDRVGVFIGDKELFYPDAQKLKKERNKLKKKTDLYSYKNMQHGWHLLPIPEAKKVLQDICKYIK